MSHQEISPKDSTEIYLDPNPINDDKEIDKPQSSKSNKKRKATNNVDDDDAQKVKKTNNNNEEDQNLGDANIHEASDFKVPTKKRRGSVKRRVGSLYANYDERTARQFAEEQKRKRQEVGTQGNREQENVKIQHEEMLARALNQSNKRNGNLSQSAPSIHHQHFGLPSIQPQVVHPAYIYAATPSYFPSTPMTPQTPSTPMPQTPATPMAYSNLHNGNAISSERNFNQPPPTIVQNYHYNNNYNNNFNQTHHNNNNTNNNGHNNNNNDNLTNVQLIPPNLNNNEQNGTANDPFSFFGSTPNDTTYDLLKQLDEYY